MTNKTNKNPSPKECREKLDFFLKELDELLEKHKVTLYAIKSDKLNCTISAFSNYTFDTDLISKNYGGEIE